MVIGGGPAGLAAAIALRRKGCQVTVLDGASTPADKACGEGLMPDALAALANIGVHLDGAPSFAFRGICFHDRGAAVAADFPTGFARGVRRTSLHGILVEHAQAAGVKLHWRAHADLEAWRGRWIVGADGECSTVRRWANLDHRDYDRRRFGFRRHYRIAPWSAYMELYWGEKRQVYVTPVERNCICVAAIGRDPAWRVDEALRHFPDLARRLEAAAVVSSERSAVTSTRKLRAVYRGRVALIGDASGSVDAITGEGLCLAFQQAEALAEAVARGDLTAYGHAHARIARRPARMAKLLVALGDHATIRRVVMAAMAAHPQIFARLLAMHVGSLHEIHHPASVLGDGSVWSGISS